MKRYKVTNVELPVADEEVASRNAMPGGEAAPSDHAPPSPKSPGSINTGRVRHPSGSSPLKSAADNGSRDLLMLANGTAVSILGTEPDWYRVQVGTRVGYLHHTWTLVDQYKMGNFDYRFIQVKSLVNHERAEEYARTSPLRLAVFQTTNGWFAVALEEAAEYSRAMELLSSLKAAHKIPADAFVTYGNNYMKKVCCTRSSATRGAS